MFNSIFIAFVIPVLKDAFLNEVRTVIQVVKPQLINLKDDWLLLLHLLYRVRKLIFSEKGKFRNKYLVTDSKTFDILISDTTKRKLESKS